MSFVEPVCPILKWKGGTVGCFVPPLCLPRSWFNGPAWNPTLPLLPEGVVRSKRSSHKTSAVLVKKEPGSHQTFIKSAPEAVENYTWQSQGAGGGQGSVMSLSNHGAWQCVTLVVILYGDQRGWTQRKAGPLLLERRGGGEEEGERAIQWDEREADLEDISACTHQLSLTVFIWVYRMSSVPKSGRLVRRRNSANTSVRC